jgi:hypothetical protein
MDMVGAAGHAGPMLLRNAIASGFKAAKANLRPGLVLWALAVAVVAAYYVPGGARSALDQLADFKQRWGYGFAIASTALWGGVIPTLFLRLFHRSHRVKFSSLLFLLLFWGFKGAEVNLLYDVLARLFGTESTWRNVIIKSCLDQLVYGPFWAVPTLALAYLWRDQGFSFARLSSSLNRHFYETTALPMLLANWGVWIPTVAAIYALPVGLQLPMQNLALCLWSLMLAFMTGKPTSEKQATSV